MYHIELMTSRAWRTAVAWQVPDTPFMQFAFWDALADSGAIGEGSGWLPMYIVAYEQTDAVAVMPVFIKHHHQGEYVFDYAWAEAYERYGQNYYPRLVTSVPFTPVTGERVWLAQGAVLTHELWDALCQGVDTLAERVKASTWHGLFVPLAIKATATQTDSACLVRYGCQFGWINRKAEGEKFADFDDFLKVLTAKKRKSIRVECQKVTAQGIRCQIKLGAELTAADWQVFYQCYAMTYLIRGRQPYLSLDFFCQIGQTMPEQLMMAQGVDASGAIVACSLFFYDARPSVSTLYGRYWGSLADYDCLHFVLCYYQGIEFAIANQLAYFDPGTQGEHKLIRGFLPTLTYSLHRVYDAKFLPAIADYCEAERAAIVGYYADALTAVPFNHDYQQALPELFSLTP